ncbi:MAG: hypothetical protein ACRD6R_06090 [Candidatus Polarisedimenticolia bacterium]
MPTPRHAVPFALIVWLAAAGAAPAEDGPLFSVYPSYSAKFDLDSEKFSLITSLVVYNISGQTFSDVGFRQAYPEGVTVKETYQREVGTEATGMQSSERSLEGNVLTGRIATFKPRMYVVLPNELLLARRLDQITFPGLEIAFKDGDGQPRTSRLQEQTYDLFIYSNVVGGLERFIKKYNNITFDFAKAAPARKEWEFAPIAASAKGRFPTGVIGTSPGENQYNGHFRVRSGPPGDNVQIVTVYRATDKKDRVADRETLLKRLREYLRWCGEFEFAADSLQVDQSTWKKYDGAWSVDGRWVDTIKDRLGEGVLKARVFWGPREDVEYFVLMLGHGRGFGTDSTVPKPEKETELLGEIDRLMESFRSQIIPLSHERRR